MSDTMFKIKLLDWFEQDGEYNYTVDAALAGDLISLYI